MKSGPTPRSHQANQHAAIAHTDGKAPVPWLCSSSLWRAGITSKSLTGASLACWTFAIPPKHGSRLNMAAIEFSVLTIQYIGGCIPNQATLRRKIAAWERQRNTRKATVNWRFTIAKARDKLGRLYPA